SWRAHRANPVDVGPDPWDGRSLEWSVPAPTPAHNFDENPTVAHLDELWHRKYQEGEAGEVARGATGEEHGQQGRRPGARPPAPWDGRSLAWTVPSPTPAHNFAEIPTVSHLDESWHRKYQEDEAGKVVRVATGEEVAQKGDGTGVHLPSPSYWPLVLAVGLLLIGYGVIFNLGLAAAGAVVLVLAGFGWGYEPADDPEAHHGPEANGDEPAADGDGAEREPVGVTAGAPESDEKASSDE